MIHSPRYALASFSLARFAILGALVAALGLAGCGRKSGLDAPPMAAAGDLQTGAAATPAGKPVPPAPDKRKTVFDWLID